jgi:hypothetical protein
LRTGINAKASSFYLDTTLPLAVIDEDQKHSKADDGTACLAGVKRQSKTAIL